MGLLSWALIPFLISIGCAAVVLLFQILMIFGGFHLNLGSNDYSKFIISPSESGDIPSLIIWQTYFLSFGFAGVSLSWLLSPLPTIMLLLITIPLAMIMGWLITRSIIKLASNLN